MPHFLSPLRLEYLDGRHWKILEAFDYGIGEPGSPLRVEIPANFITDFASIPRIFWNIFPPSGSYGKAGVVHDYLYRNCLIHDLEAHTGADYIRCTRADADKIFFQAMGVLGTKLYVRLILYAGVRLGGWAVWSFWRCRERQTTR